MAPDDQGVELLSVDTVAAYLTSRKVLGNGSSTMISQLGGGVSNVVLSAACGPERVVVKQALPRLRVADEWLAKRERALSEAAALALVAKITPEAVPGVLDVDDYMCALTIAMAPAGWVTWKTRLLARDADPAVAELLGRRLGIWHRTTDDDAAVANHFCDYAAFEQLRVDPFYRTVAVRRPELADAIAPLIARMEATHRCLVHGDYSPKNVLVAPDGVAGDSALWVIDFEVAHFGDPVFDVAFMAHHLLLKLVRAPESAAAIAACLTSFWDAYAGEVPADLLPSEAYLVGHVGALMVARVDGKSPVDYLAERERNLARELGTQLLLEPPESLSAGINLVQSSVV